MNAMSPASHMIPPASCWSASAVIPYGRAERRVVVVQRRRGEQDGHAEERVERQLRAAGTARAPGSPAVAAPGRSPTTGHQNRSAATRYSAVLEVVDAAVLERDIEQRREVAAPEHEREGQPGHDRVGEHRDRRSSGGPAAGSALPHSR